jgi:hypothetical protein
MKPDNQSLIGSAEWNALVQGTSVGFRSLAVEKLESADLSQMIAYLDSAPIEEQAVAIQLLHAATRDIPISEPEKEVLIGKLRPIMASYPEKPGLSAFMLMCYVALPLAEKFLMEEADPSQIPENYFRNYLVDLKRIKSSRAMDRIVGYSKLDGERGEIAKRTLKRFGIIAPAELEELAAKWRETKSISTLNDLYEFHVQYQGRKPIGPLLELLGPWNRHGFADYWYDSAQGPSLYMHADEHGNLDGFKLK